MAHILNFSSWLRLNEGGWSSTLTQNTTLTPKVLKAADDATREFATAFNSYLKGIGLPEIKFIRPVGSGTWYEQDLIDQPDKTYGDIDYMVSYPLLGVYPEERKDEIESVKTYNEELLRFIYMGKTPKVNPGETEQISNASSVKLMLELDVDGEPAWVQVDMVVTHGPYEEWSLARFTPIRNVKGFVVGSLYKALSDALGLSIQSRGVRAKFNGELLAPWSKRAGVQEKAISLDFRTFLKDIVEFFHRYEGGSGDAKISDYLKKQPGLDANSLSIDGIAAGIRALAETLEANGLFGKTLNYRDAQDFVNQVVKNYEEAMMVTYNAKKFDKAETPAAHAAVQKTRNLIEEYIAKVKHALA